MARQEPVVNMHMPASLKRALEEAAAREQRTLTREIVFRLEQSLLRDEVILGVREAPAGYDLAKGSLDKLPEDMRQIAVRILCTLDRGLPVQEEAVQPYRKNSPAPAPRNSVRSKKTRPKGGPRQSGNGSDK